MNFALALEGPEEEIAACSVLEQSNSSSFCCRLDMLWKWYSIREELNIQEAHGYPSSNCRCGEMHPSCYWIRGLSSAEIQKALFEALKHRPGRRRRQNDACYSQPFREECLCKVIEGTG